MTNGSTGTTQVTLDVLGYFLSGTPAFAGTFAGAALRPRAGHHDGARHGQGTRSRRREPSPPTIAGAGGVPASGVSAVVLNVTAKERDRRRSIEGLHGRHVQACRGVSDVRPRHDPVRARRRRSFGQPEQISVTSTSTGTVDVTADVLGYVLSGTASPPPPSAPTVTALSPDLRTRRRRHPVTITGTNFTGATAVKFGTSSRDLQRHQRHHASPPQHPPEPAPSTSPSPPAAAPARPTPATSTPTSHRTPPPAPTVTGLNPTSGPTAGGTPVTITGTNFTGATAVKFGTTSRDLHRHQRHHHRRHRTRRHRHRRRHRHHQRRNQHHQRRRPVHLHAAPPPAPTSPGSNPTSGPTAGGTPVTITGTNFTGATAVNFGTTIRQLHRHQRHHHRRHRARRHRHRRRHRHHQRRNQHHQRRRPATPTSRHHRRARFRRRSRAAGSSTVRPNRHRRRRPRTCN